MSNESRFVFHLFSIKTEAKPINQQASYFKHKIKQAECVCNKHIRGIDKPFDGLYSIRQQPFIKKKSNMRSFSVNDNSK